MNYNYNMNFFYFSYNYNLDFNEQSSNNLFNANNKSTRARCEICSQLAIKIPKQCQYCPSDITANFDYVAHRVTLSLLLTFK